MLRVLIGTGALLMAVGFGAAGWQYWQSLPKPVWRIFWLKQRRKRN